ncbi:unnamed protein product [Somion occarium]|uniref:Uncharacterized protein n=1 Tax=Somion occarium TaxID=3059160 RepID=A0ABP1E8H5_9APHY
MAVSDSQPSSRGLPPLLNSPTKNSPDLRANPHPYAIRTTSTALLTRSNSTGYNTNATRHYYIPTSPSPRYENGRTHRFAKSQPSNMSTDQKAPRPLPVPPPFPSAVALNGYTSADEQLVAPRRTKRADTLPSFPAPYTPATVSVTLDDLPSNPKLWSPSQLSSYLVTALRVTSTSKSEEIAPISLPARVAIDIATFVRDARMTGRTFLRLNEEDLDVMNVNKKWREALLIASRNLRQNVLKGRIWGADADGPSSPRSTSPIMPAHPFSNMLYNSSSSSVDLSLKDEDEAKRPKRYRNGRVRGMVDSLERSGSFSSESSCDEGSGRPTFGRWVQEDGPIQEEVVWSPTAVTHSPLPDTGFPAPPSAIREEPSIEDLLASEAQGASGHTWGARAWEEMDMEAGVTVKPVRDGSGGSDNSLTSISRPSHETFLTLGKRSGKVNSKGKGKEERRVITAIFQPSMTDTGSEITHDSHVATRIEEHAQTDGDTDMSLSKTLEAIEQTLFTQVAENRALLERFRGRLEIVEKKVAVLEEQEAQWQKDQELRRAALVADEDTASNGSFAPLHTDKAVGEDIIPSLLSQAASLIPGIISSPSPTSSSATKYPPEDNFPTTLDDNDEDEDEEEPSSLLELPSYVLLVGLGVCAVVLRIMFRKVGPKTSLTWKQ